MVRVEQVNPLEFAETASAILEESWPAPHVRYTPDYLGWQLSYPGQLIPLAVAALDGQEPVGFAAATPRRARFRGLLADLYIVSFVAVRHGWRGRGVAARLYATLLDGIRSTAAPVVTFAEADSAAQRRLLDAYSDADFQVGSLGSYPAYGYLSRRHHPDAANEIECCAEISEVARVMGNGDDAQLLRAELDSAVVEHLRADPRPRRGVLVRETQTSAVAAAMAVLQEVVDRDSVTRLPVIERLSLRGPSAGTLGRLLHAAPRLWPAETYPVVSLPNVCGIDEATLRSAGVRRMPSIYAGYICAQEPNHPFLQATGTDFEVI